MEKNVIAWAIGITLLVSVVANLGSFTGNAAKNLEPFLSVANPAVAPGYNLQIVAGNSQTSQEYQIFDALTDRYTGSRFFSRASRCERQKNVGAYVCNLEYNIPGSMKAGNYYVQAKDKREVKLVGNKAYFTVTG